MKTRMLRALIVFFALPPSLLGQTNPPARDQLQQLTTHLQQSPGDQALREKIIALALALNPKPATPDPATMAEGAAEYAFNNAKANSDFSDAAKQYEKALLLAPWLAADYFNCGIAHEKAGEEKEAIRNFNLLPAGRAECGRCAGRKKAHRRVAVCRPESRGAEQRRSERSPRPGGRGGT
ncbi:MAG TPA: hypothetical protein VN223_05670 [Candidatus Elarobacter sp.]|nr:hypothetical protein [Candidatus Elarobacter sp.]